jgi:hypothetical protein
MLNGGFEDVQSVRALLEDDRWMGQMWESADCVFDTWPVEEPLRPVEQSIEVDVVVEGLFPYTGSPVSSSWLRPKPAGTSTANDVEEEEEQEEWEDTSLGLVNGWRCVDLYFAARLQSYFSSLRDTADTEDSLHYALESRQAHYDCWRNSSTS